MNDRIDTEVEFMQVSEPAREILVALLADAGYEGFEEAGDRLKAYAASHIVERSRLDDWAHTHAAGYALRHLPETNWNAVWESNFEPVTIDDFCGIRAEFHAPALQVAHDIVITPKMSFGTGHHATTFMMIRQMKDIDFAGKTVLDFGTGTGVLAVLAEKQGAARVLAIDYDDWSIANAGENIARNGSRRITLAKADTAAGIAACDIILANVTRNVILDNLSFFGAALLPGGTLLLSGLLQEDEAVITSAAGGLGLAAGNTMVRDKWICLRADRR